MGTEREPREGAVNVEDVDDSEELEETYTEEDEDYTPENSEEEY